LSITCTFTPRRLAANTAFSSLVSEKPNIFMRRLRFASSMALTMG
jgi:hypothetical protein